MKINYRTKTDEACQNDVNLSQLTKLIIDARRFLKSNEVKTTKVIHNNTTNLIVWSQEPAVFSYSLSHRYSLIYRMGQLTYMASLYSARCYSEYARMSIHLLQVSFCLLFIRTLSKNTPNGS